MVVVIPDNTFQLIQNIFQRIRMFINTGLNRSLIFQHLNFMRNTNYRSLICRPSLLSIAPLIYSLYKALSNHHASKRVQSLCNKLVIHKKSPPAYTGEPNSQQLFNLSAIPNCNVIF